MSFPRAKIHRFNESKGCTPAPGSYNPKFDHKIIGIGAVIEKSERFTEPKSNGGGLNDVLNHSFTCGSHKSSSLNSLPVFRTPKVPVKKMSSYSKSTFDLTSGQSGSTDSLDLLRDAQKSKEDMINELEYLLKLKTEEVQKLAIELDEVVEKNKVEKVRCDDELSILMAQIAKLESSTLLNNGVVELAELKVNLSEKEAVIVEISKKMQDSQDSLQSVITKHEQEMGVVEHLLSESKLEQSVYESKLSDLLAVIEQRGRLIRIMEEVQNTSNEDKSSLERNLVKLRYEQAEIDVKASKLAKECFETVRINELLAQQVDGLKEEVDCLTKANTNLQRDINKCVSDFSYISQINIQLDEKVDKLERELMHLQSVEGELYSQVSQLEHRIEVKELFISNLEHTMELVQLDSNSEKVILEDKMAEMDHELNVLIEAQEELEKMLLQKSQTIVQLESELKETRLEMSHVEMESSTVQSNCDRKVAELQQNLAEMIQSKIDLENKLSQKQSMILLLQSELSEKEVQLVENSTDYTKLAEHLESEKVRLHAETRAEVSKLSKIIEILKDNYVKQLSEYEGNTKVLQENILNGSLLRENLETTIYIKHSEFSKLEEKFSSLKEEYESKIANQVKDAESKYNEVVFELLETHAKLHRTEGHLEEVESHSKKSKEELEDYMAILLAEKEANVWTRDELRVYNLEYQLTIVELHEKVEGLTLEIDTNMKLYEIKLGDVRSQLEVSQLRCKKLQICNDNLQESLVAIRDRLMESSSHTEVQNNLILNLEACNLLLEKKIEVQSQVLEAQKLSIDNLEVKNIDDINKMRSELLGKLEELRKSAIGEKEALMKSSMKHEQMVKSQLVALSEEMNVMAREKTQMSESYSTLQKSFKSQGVVLEETKFDLLRSKDRLKLEEQKSSKYSDELKDLLSSYKMEIAKYTKDLQSALTLIESSNLAHDHEVKELTDALEAARLELHEAIIADQENEREIDSLFEKLDHQTECAKLANQKISTLENQHLAQCNELESLALKLESQQHDHVNAALCNETLVKENNEHLVKIQKLSESLRLKCQNCSDLEDQLSRLKSKMMSIQTDQHTLLLQVKDDYQAKICSLEADKCGLNEEVLKLTSELESQKEYCENASKLNNTIFHANKAKEFEIEYLKEELRKQTKSFECISTELKEHMLSTETLISDKDANLRNLRAEYQGKIKSLQAEISVKTTELHAAISSANESDAEMKKLKCSDWERRYHEIESLIGPFRQQLEEYEAERGFMESRKEAADHEVKDLSLKYAAILGHQNHKQKIRHVVNLKEHNLELKQDLEKAEAELRLKEKTIKSLRSDVATLTRKNTTSEKGRRLLAPLASKMKENSPARQQSPGVAQPLRELANC